MRARSSSSAGVQLDPVRWPRWPGRVAGVRALLVTALLVVAAGVLYQAPTGEGSSPADRCAAVRPTAVRPTAVRPTAGHPARSGSEAVAAPLSGDAAPPSGPAGLALPAGTLGVPVRVAEPATLSVLRPGSRVDLVAVPVDRPARVLATNALVLAVGPPTAGPARTADPPGRLAEPGVLVLALPVEQARTAAESALLARMGVLVRAG